MDNQEFDKKFDKEPEGQPEQQPEPQPEKPLLTIEDIQVTSTLGVVEADTLQLQVDALNVMENRVAMNTFPPAYQNRIRNYYRFAPVTGGGAAGKIAMAAAGRNAKG